LKAIIEDVRKIVLEEPDDRAITILSPLPSYYAWVKLLIKYEELTVVATRKLTIERLHAVIRRGVDQPIEETSDL